MLRISLYLSLVAALCSSLGCERAKDSQDSIRKAFEDITTSSDSALQELKNVRSEDAIEELKKLRQFEYKVVTFPADVTPSLLEVELTGLGKSFWECFHIEKLIKEEKPILAVICKRKAETPLHYLPQSILGR